MGVGLPNIDTPGEWTVAGINARIASATSAESMRSVSPPNGEFLSRPEHDSTRIIDVWIQKWRTPSFHPIPNLLALRCPVTPQGLRVFTVGISIDCSTSLREPSRTNTSQGTSSRIRSSRRTSASVTSGIRKPSGHGCTASFGARPSHTFDQLGARRRPQPSNRRKRQGSTHSSEGNPRT